VKQEAKGETSDLLLAREMEAAKAVLNPHPENHRPYEVNEAYIYSVRRRRETDLVTKKKDFTTRTKEERDYLILEGKRAAEELAAILRKKVEPQTKRKKNQSSSHPISQSGGTAVETKKVAGIRGRIPKNPVSFSELAKRCRLKKMEDANGNTAKVDYHELRQGLPGISYQDAYQMYNKSLARLDELILLQDARITRIRRVRSSSS
jgi:hypothetical protein